MVKTRKHRNYKRGGWWNPFAKKPAVNTPIPAVITPTPAVNTPTPTQCMFNDQNIIERLNEMNEYAIKEIKDKYQRVSGIAHHNKRVYWTDEKKNAYVYIKYVRTKLVDKKKDSEGEMTLAYLRNLYRGTNNCMSVKGENETMLKKAQYYIKHAIDNFGELFGSLKKEENARANAKATAMSNGGKRKTKKTRKTQKKSRKSRKC